MPRSFLIFGVCCKSEGSYIRCQLAGDDFSMQYNQFFVLILPLVYFASTGCEKAKLRGSVEAIGTDDLSITCDEGNETVFRMLLGESRQVNYTLINKTNRDLHVKSIVASCGCAYPTLANKTLLPGVKATMFVTLVAEKVGAINHHIRLELSNGTVNEYLVDFHTVVVTPIVTKPEQIDLCLPDGFHSLDFEILSASDDPFELLLIDCKCDDLDFKLIYQSKTSVTLSLQVEVDPVRIIDTVITILVDSEFGVYTHEVPVKIRSQDEPVVSPDD